MNTAFREYLNRPRMLTAKLSDAVTQFHDLWAACTKQTTSFDTVGGHGGGGGDAKDGILAAFADFSNSQNRYREELDDAKRELRRFFETLRPRDALLLELRYVQLLDWNDVHKKLSDKGYPCLALRTVLNWHTEALNRGERIWEDTQHGKRESHADDAEDC